jgi:hypothetical protein
MNILSIFAGRTANIQVLSLFLQKAIKYRIIDEVHFWNYTRNVQDEEYLKSISNLKRTSSVGSGNYILIHPIVLDDCFELNVKATNDIHIKLVHDVTEYEIVLGGWKNTISVIRENGCELCRTHQTNIANGNNHTTFQIRVYNSDLYIQRGNDILMVQKIKPSFKIHHVYFKTGHGCIGDLTFKPTQNEGFYFMDTCEKTWKNYYNYYNDRAFVNDVIIKCDDDIVFIDIQKLPQFFEVIKLNDYDLVFANTINNGVSAFFQQNKYNLIPKELMDLEYPHNGCGGSLWESGLKAERLHDYFIENFQTFIDYNSNNDIIPITTRYSINFFGYKGCKWYKIKQACPYDDEHCLTVVYQRERGFKNVFYSDLYVSHLSFNRQLSDHMDLKRLREKYSKLYEIYCRTNYL